MARDAPRRGAVNHALETMFPTPDDGLRFADRHEAGRRLAALLERFRDQGPVVVGIPRGGVPVAAEVATVLGAPLDVTMVRKIGAPQNPEYGIGAVAEGGVRVLSDEAVSMLAVDRDTLDALVSRAEGQLAERLERYRGDRPALSVQGRRVILVDDGLATGRTAIAAARSLRERGAARVILAVPVAAAQSVEAVRSFVDEIVAVQVAIDLVAIGLWYEDFTPTSDEEVAALLGGVTA